jgi:hypothetical protein
MQDLELKPQYKKKKENGYGSRQASSGLSANLQFGTSLF